MSVLYASPYTPPVPDDFTPWKGIRHTWTGWDGSVWNLSDAESGVFILADGLEGLYFPDIQNYLTQSPVVHGVGWESWISTGRKVYWNVGVFHDGSSTGWVELNRAFMRTFRPGTTGVWSVELPSGETLNLTLRLADDNSHMFAQDPAYRGWEVYGISLFPEQPFWEARTVVGQWVVGQQRAFLGLDGVAGPPFIISPASQLAKATVTNPGDVEAFIEWTVVGPSNSATVGLNGEVTVVPFEVPAGSTLVIDTDPRNLIAELDGVDVMDQLTEFNYPALPPGEDVALTLSMTGTGSIEARFKPLKLMGV